MVSMIARLAGIVALIAAMGAPPAGAAVVGFKGVAPEDAVGGYDAVALSEGREVKGQGRYTYVFRGLQWRFSSETNKQRFRSDPDAYIPD
jgi:YHS domain-containing protein